MCIIAGGFIALKVSEHMAGNLTTMHVGRYTFEYDFDTRGLRLSWTGEQTVLDPDETIALGDFLFEVMRTQGRTPRILPLTITNVEAESQAAEEYQEEEDEEVEGDGSGLHQCPYCYDQVYEDHEEFCSLNPNRNREIVP